MSVIIIKPLAESDLMDIWEFIAEDSLERADQILEQIYQQMSRLATMPNMGKQREDLIPSLRSFPVKSYLIFYFPISDGVEILRVLQGSRNLDIIF